MCGEGDSLKMIPLWSIILAILVFLASYTSSTARLRRIARPGSLPMHIIFTLHDRHALASYVLLVGYVSRDVEAAQHARRAVDADRRGHARRSSARSCTSCCASRS